MKEIIYKTDASGRNIVLGYTTLKVSTSDTPSTKLYKVFRLTFGDIDDEGDIHIFENINGDWILKSEMSLINVQNDALVEMYQFISKKERINFHEFVDLMCTALGLF